MLLLLFVDVAIDVVIDVVVVITWLRHDNCLPLGRGPQLVHS